MRTAACLLAVALLGALAPAAAAAPPPNDAPASPGFFEPYTAKAGQPGDLQAVAELAEATPEPDVARCLGASSFARTVWYRIDPVAYAREIAVDATGTTLDDIDLAAFVQPATGALQLSRANVCAGAGVFGADAAEDATTALGVRIPPNRSVLLQVGRRGPVGSAAEEQVQLTFAATAVPSTAPAGDGGNLAAPQVGRSGRDTVGLSGATTTEEDVATPRCQALATVWRRFRSRRSARLTFSVRGRHAGTLAVFRGRRPSPAGFLDCVDRDGPGAVTLPLKVRKREWVTVRVGTDAPPIGARGRVRIERARRGDRVSGGSCLGNPDSRVSGRLTGGTRSVRALRRSRWLRLALRVERGPVCTALLELRGPKNRVYARAQVGAVRGRGQLVHLRRTRKLARGRYRLRVESASYAGVRIRTPTTVSFTLR